MIKKVGIYYRAKFEEESFETGCGGSDAWVIQVAKEFVKQGYYVVVFCDTPNWKLTHSMVEYCHLDNLPLRCKLLQHFDYFIMTRCFYENIYNMVVELGCENIYLQSHDMFIWNKELYYNKFIYQPNKYPYLKKFIALTDFHKWELQEYNQIPENMIEVIGNGLDSDILSKVENEPLPEKDNSILFSSVYTRGGDILVNYILPLVKKEIPDFKVRLCGYADVYPEDLKHNPNVEILGMLTKEDYYREFRKHKVWFLPCVVPEDFGLCVGDAVISGCEIVSTFKHGMKDVCKPFVHLSMKNEFKVKETGKYHCSSYTLDMNEKDFNETCQEAANMIIDSIRNYDDEEKKKQRESFKKYMVETHTWEHVVNKWVDLFESGH
ncbi:MAG: glycosyltransferase family 4 protein [Lachnospiraceae bacterium]|nr:glycosyltransferase family 4 protein [Lachnospiraceae bacterium]